MKILLQGDMESRAKQYALKFVNSQPDVLKKSIHHQMCFEQARAQRCVQLQHFDGREHFDRSILLGLILDYR